ncbi:Mur ligase family protein [Dankookia sp. P2]|uniref:Mur ligase family protein n=1 Tax=Dankookia sp. P2 TaxID=3423955 RepID=UPI003D67E414
MTGILDRHPYAGARRPLRRAARRAGRHDFVADALAAGAAAAMVDRDILGLPADAPLLRVADTLAGLTALSAAGRARCAGASPPSPAASARPAPRRCCGCCWAPSVRPMPPIASYNNHWGVPLTLARMPAGTAFAVIEIGMNNPERDPAAGPPRRAACRRRHHDRRSAAWSSAHMGSIEAVADEKGDIAAGLVPGGTAVLPRDSAFFDRLLGHRPRRGAARIISFVPRRARDPPR